MKYLYCPSCKELRVKPWYSVTDRCTRCRGDVRVIRVPRTALTYAIWALMAAAFALLFLHTRVENSQYLYAAVVLVVVLMVIQFKELSRGHRYAMSKIRITSSDHDEMRKKGWR